MKKKMVLLLLLIVTFVSVFFYAPFMKSYACSCVPPGAPVEEMKESSAVFLGKVTEIANKDRGSLTFPPDIEQVAVQFEVEKSWKGLNQKEVVVYTASNSASCGFEFEVGREYLVYASEGEGNLQTSYCTRTAQLEMADEDIAELGEGKQITEKEAKTKYETSVENSGNTGVIYPVAVGIGILLLTGIVFFRMKRKH
ncbi:hypothetical protein [Salirhabdus sp. Marseille-P4669]|uniref:hypothetical protein n=1 Tax=Salirhabdus sp. Marseille-P4669 TaxID=2042310 RepID=UPI000C7B4EB6|nr:hypothetical protein [Salirhabdus sp. Marseille-P4669]